MILDALLSQLTAAGVVLTVEAERLRYKAPVGALTPELRAGIAAHRAELIRRLSGKSTSPSAGARWPADYFATWVARPDAAGRLGWEAPGLPDQDRWWGRRAFDDLPGYTPDKLPGCGIAKKGE